MKLIKLSFVLLVALVATACDSNLKLTDKASGNIEAYESSDLNAINQAKPVIMIIPSDKSLMQYGCLEIKKYNGKDHYIRDYKRYLISDESARPVFSYVQSSFVNAGFPLSDLEQALKQLDTQVAMDEADNLEKDAKTILLTTIRPDIIIELSYDSKSGAPRSLLSHDYGYTKE